MAQAALVPAPAAERTGGVVEFLAVGGATLVLFPLLWVLRRAIGLDAAELAVGFLMFHGAHVINDPHFAVTYLLFYGDARERAFGGDVSAAQRARYVIAGLVVPIALAAWAGVALAHRSAHGLGLLIQLMFLLVGWHYAKQGFGVLVVLAGRRGVTFTALERGALLAHAYAGWAYAWASPADKGTEVEEKGVVYTTVAHSLALEHVTLAVFAASAVALAVVLAMKWRRERKLPLFGPLVALLCSVWLWSIWSSVDPLMVYVNPALHSVQYLYMVWLLKRNEARAEEGPPAFGLPVRVRVGLLAVSALGLGAVLFHAAPSALDAMLVPRRSRLGDLGATPYFAALFAIVNIHHYFMDWVIWRRENPTTRYLRG